MEHDRESLLPTLRDRWLARAAIAVIVALQFSLISNLGYGARWLSPVLELALLIPLTALTLRAEVIAWRAHSSVEWRDAAWYRRFNLILAQSLIIVISLANSRSLVLLLRALVSGTTHSGRALLLDALNVWATNVIVFALWYWKLDGGGPSIDPDAPRGRSDVIFPHMTLRAEMGGANVPPGFIDYLFLSFTVSTAFSPTDTPPLTTRMKLLMMLEASVSLLTLAIVAARAVNILA